MAPQALKALREAAETVQKPETPNATTSSNIDGDGGSGVHGEKSRSKEDVKQSRMLLGLGALLARDPSAAVQVPISISIAF